MRTLFKSDRVAGWLTLAARPQFLLNLLKKKADRPTIYFVVHNRNHVKLTHRTAAYLAQLPVRVEFCIPRGFVHARFARKALNEYGLQWIPVAELKQRLKSRDKVIVQLDQSPVALKKALAKAQTLGAPRIALMEGSRFSKRVFPNIDHVLVWGKSSNQHFRDRSTIVGSPVIEDMRVHAPASPDSKIAVINYKFTWKESNLDADRNWLKNALNAVRNIGLDPIISVHPAMTENLTDLPISAEPIEVLMSRARILVSRPSTVILQAMNIGVQPFLMSVPNDDLREFAEPFGAYDLSTNRTELQSQIQAFLAGQSGYDHQQFLSCHVDERKNDPAYRRIARAILDQM